MSTNIGKSCLVSARVRPTGTQHGVVIGERKVKGKARLTVRFEDGTEMETGVGNVTIPEVVGPPMQFAPADPTALARPLGDFYGDRARMTARWKAE